MEKAENNDRLNVNQDVPLCHNCFSPNDPQAHFCHKCNTPLSVLASMDPVARIWSMGDTFRKAASRPYRPIILIGMWLLFGPRLLYAFLLTFSFATSICVVSTEMIAPLGVGAASVVLYAAILFKTTRNYYRIKRQQATESSDLDNGEPD